MENEDDWVYGPDECVKAVVSKRTGFPVGQVSLARDIRGGWIRRLEIGGARLTRSAGCELGLLPELVDGFAREVKTIGGNRLRVGSSSGYYANRNGMFRAYPSQNERTGECFYRLYCKASRVAHTYNLETVRDFLKYGTLESGSEHATKGKDETDDTVL